MKLGKPAPFPAIMTLISFVLFVCIYSQVTVTAIEPYYFQGLIFALPFISFGITTLFSAKGKLETVESTIITGILIFVLAIVMLFAYIFMAFDAATSVTTDISKYERVLKLTGYPDNQLIKYFPNKVPSAAKNIIFRYNPALMQADEVFNLKFETDSASIKNYIDEFSQKAKWIGKSSDSEAEKKGIFSVSFNAFGFEKLPEDFTIYLVDSEPYLPGDWNQGKLGLVAISKQRNEIIFLAEDR